MGKFHESMNEYRIQLQKGAIQEAYRGLMNYIMGLRLYFEKKYPVYTLSGSIYFGYMDMTYFSFFPQSLKRRGLKVGIVFVHTEFRFKVWLFAYNKTVQSKYWKLFKESGWDKYRIPSTTKSVDFIMEGILVKDPDFSDLDALTKQIEKGTLSFIEDVERYLTNNRELG